MRIDIGLDGGKPHGVQPAAGGKRSPVAGGADHQRRQVVHMGDDDVLQLARCREMGAAQLPDIKGQQPQRLAVTRHRTHQRILGVGHQWRQRLPR